MMSVRVRIAPSPTGDLHIGTVRTALFNYLFAKKHGGTFIMRIEDTDKARNTQESEDAIISGLLDLGLEWDEGGGKGGDYGPYHQSKRYDLYRSALESLLEGDKAYFCFCTKEQLDVDRKEQEKKKQAPRYVGRCASLSREDQIHRYEKDEKCVIRIRVPKDRDIYVHDLIRGETVQNSSYMQDFVIARTIDDPLFYLVNVVDDALMEITHVIRGEEHLPNTFKQIILYEALGYSPPKFAHLGLILDEKKKKLSKRNNVVSLKAFLDKGYLKEAILNFLVLLGWNPGTEQELFSVADLEQEFSIERCQKAGAIWDQQKLDWFNAQYIKRMPIEELLDRVLPYLEEAGLVFCQDDGSFGLRATGETLEKALMLRDLSILNDRIKFLSEAPELMKFFFVKDLDYDGEMLLWKKMSKDDAVKALNASIELLSNPDTSFELGDLEVSLRGLAEHLDMKVGHILWPVRIALSGEQYSPGAFELLWCFGREESLYRLKAALKKAESL